MSQSYVLIVIVLRLVQTLPPVSLSDCIRLFAVVRHSVLRLMQPGSDIGGLFPLFILNFILIVKPFTLCEANRFYNRFHTPCPNISKVTLHILLY